MDNDSLHTLKCVDLTSRWVGIKPDEFLFEKLGAELERKNLGKMLYMDLLFKLFWFHLVQIILPLLSFRFLACGIRYNNTYLWGL